MMKEHFNKELLTTIENDEDFENVSADGDVKVRDHCHIAKKYKDSAHKDCNIKVNQ